MYHPLVCTALNPLILPPPSQSIIPSDYSLSDTEKSNVCYLSFPDSNSGESTLCVCVGGGGGQRRSDMRARLTTSASVIVLDIIT